MKTHDTLNRRLREGDARPRGDRVTRQITDLSILEALHRFGPQTTQALYELLYPLYKDDHSLRKRLKLLRHEQETSGYGGPLLFCPSQQSRGASRPERNLLIYDILPRGERLLKNAGLWREHHPTTNNQEWKHDFFTATITASIAIAARKNGAVFVHHDEVVKNLTLPFDVPDYKYQSENGREWKTRTGVKLKPDGFFALTYPEGGTRIYLVEADCRTEPNRSDDHKRKSRKHNILSYHALITNGERRSRYFGNAKVGVLNVFTHPSTMRSVMKMQEDLIGDKAKFMAYQSWEAFGDYFRPPPPRHDLYLEGWHTVGSPPAFICKEERAATEP